METWILKLGGGAITHKDTNERRARLDVLRRVARELRAAREARPLRLVAVHGAGPFGHSLVTTYDLARGVTTPRQVEGFVRTHASMLELNRQLVEVLAEEGLLVVPVPPSACVVQADRRIESFFVEPLERLLALDHRLLPLLHGDMVSDRVLGASVVSGDALVAELGRRLGARRVLLGTDVPGIFTADPKLDPSARRLPLVTRENLEEVLVSVGEATTVDVTGGMRGKLAEIARALTGLEVLVFDLTEPGALQRALLGEAVEGTELRL